MRFPTVNLQVASILMLLGFRGAAAQTAEDLLRGDLLHEGTPHDRSGRLVEAQGQFAEQHVLFLRPELAGACGEEHRDPLARPGG